MLWVRIAKRGQAGPPIIFFFEGGGLKHKIQDPSMVNTKEGCGLAGGLGRWSAERRRL
jgi:hypothetical protein